MACISFPAIHWLSYSLLQADWPWLQGLPLPTMPLSVRVQLKTLWAHLSEVPTFNMYLDVSPCLLLDPSSPGNSQDHSEKEERAGWTGLAWPLCLFISHSLTASQVIPKYQVWMNCQLTVHGTQDPATVHNYHGNCLQEKWLGVYRSTLQPWDDKIRYSKKKKKKKKRTNDLQ